MTEKIEQKIEKFWRDATASDIAKVIKGEKVEARFRDVDTDTWSVSSFLGGYDATCPISLHWISNNANQWKQCQVYDPPQWYIDKPDPGEGYRLLEKFPPEELRSGFDDVYDVESQSWLGVATISSEQKETVWYRRRVEPNSPEKLDSSTCASNIPKGWTALSDDEPRLASDAFWSVGAKDWVIIDECRLEYANRDKWPAIRQINSFVSLIVAPSAYEWVTSVGDRVRLPNGKRLKVTHAGLEVF